MYNTLQKEFGMKIHFVNTGCFKNLVDTERLMKQVKDLNHNVSFGNECEQADLVVINTCGFISDSEAFSLNVIRQFAQKRHTHQINQLWVMGCLSQKKGMQIKQLIPEVDKLFGNFDWLNVIHELGGLPKDNFDRMITTPSHYAFLKIAEGCSRTCSYCIKPLINGPLRSRPIDDIVFECKQLVDQGVKEFQIVAQNTTDYGIDLYKKQSIAELIARLSDISGVDWIRIHYGYPAHFPMDLLKVMRERENVCKYLDMAIQHCSTKMLQLMHRHITKNELISLLQQIREEVPGIFLRTTLLVGHPGETDDDFQELCDFVKKYPFERMGVFPYSHEKDSFAGKMYTDILPLKIKQERALHLMELQQKIYIQQNNAQIGKQVKVIVDSKNGNYYQCRTQYSTPIADPFVQVSADNQLELGRFYTCELTKTLNKNMEGKVIQ